MNVTDQNTRNSGIGCILSIKRKHKQEVAIFINYDTSEQTEPLISYIVAYQGWPFLPKLDFH